mmetsp:Transcript_96107/g.228895  ORF Transcript_96107/g.228895 Transcript_96107/m.228895 type:complete len:274 (-) Transcript_96107:110-931(-)
MADRVILRAVWRIVSSTLLLKLRTGLGAASFVVNTNFVCSCWICRPASRASVFLAGPSAALLICIAHPLRPALIRDPAAAAGVRAAKGLAAFHFPCILVGVLRACLEACRASSLGARRCAASPIAGIRDHLLRSIQHQALAVVAGVGTTGWLTAEALVFTIGIDRMQVRPDGHVEGLAHNSSAGVLAAVLRCPPGGVPQLQWHLLVFGARHSCAGLIAALLVAAAGVALVGIIGDKMPRARPQCTRGLAALAVRAARDLVEVGFENVALATRI